MRIPCCKLQTPESREAAAIEPSDWGFEFGVSLGFGFWFLEL
jgi:hypothetical protein